jgi:hypothetical protein
MIGKDRWIWFLFL